MIENLQQPRVDLIAVRQQLVEIHGAHDGADVGHRQVNDRRLELVDLVGRARRVDHLEERHAVDPHHGVVPRDDVLARDVEHLLLHVHAVADALHHRDEDVQAGLQGARVAAEVLDRVVHALRDDLDRRPQDHDGEDDEQHAEDFEAARKGAQHLRFHGLGPW